MNLIVDGVVIGLILLFALAGLIKGFYKTAIGFLGTALSLVITYFITGPIANALMGVDTLNAFVHGPLAGVAEIMKIASVDVITVAATIFTVVVFLLTFVVVRLLMMILTVVLKNLVRDKRVGGVGRLLGFLMGAVKGAMFVIVLLAIGTAFSGALPANIQDSLYGTGSISGKFVGQHIKTQVNKYVEKEIKDLFTDSDDDDDEEETALQTAQSLLAGNKTTLKSGVNGIINKNWANDTSGASFRDLLENADPAAVTAIDGKYADIEGYIDVNGEDFTGFLTGYLNDLADTDLATCQASLQTVNTHIGKFETMSQKHTALANAIAAYDSTSGDLSAVETALDEFVTAAEAFFGSFNDAPEMGWTQA